MGLISESGIRYESVRTPLPQVYEHTPRIPTFGVIFDERRHDGFPKEAHLQAQKLKLTESVFEGRSEAHTSFTIDGKASKDLDDAIGLEKTDYGYRLHVSIADVASLIDLDTPVDKEATRRSFTEYLSWGNKPMIPRVLSEDRLSLHEGQKRPTITVSIPISLPEIGKPEIARTFLVSAKRFSYTEADDLLKNGHSEFGDVLKQCDSVAQGLSERRKRRGATVIFDLKQGLGTSEEGVVREIPDDEAYEADRIIREFMILTNETLGTYFAENDIPTLYRNHDSVLLRAYYDPEIRGHAGLGLTRETPYLHFTSPIRRLPDLITHRQLIAKINGQELPYQRTDLEEIAQTVNSNEKRIKEGKSKFMLSKANRKAFDTIVSGEFGELNLIEFTRVIKVAVKGGVFRQELQDEILARLQQGRLRQKDISFLLTQNVPTVVKESLLSWLNKTSGVYNDVLRDFGNDLGVSKPEFTTSKDEEGFYSTASLDFNEEHIESGTFDAQNRKTAERHAGVDLLRKVVERIK
jgi:ribonuclease R